MTDAYNLFSSMLPNRFGPEVYSLIEKELKNMYYAKTEAIFEESFSNAMNLLKDSGTRSNAILEEQLRKYSNFRECYAQFLF